MMEAMFVEHERESDKEQNYYGVFNISIMFALG